MILHCKPKTMPWCWCHFTTCELTGWMLTIYLCQQWIRTLRYVWLHAVHDEIIICLSKISAWLALREKKLPCCEMWHIWGEGQLPSFQTPVRKKPTPSIPQLARDRGLLKSCVKFSANLPQPEPQRKLLPQVVPSRQFWEPQRQKPQLWHCSTPEKLWDCKSVHCFRLQCLQCYCAVAMAVVPSHMEENTYLPTPHATLSKQNGSFSSFSETFSRLL